MEENKNRIKKLEAQAHYQMTQGHLGRGIVLYAKLENLYQKEKEEFLADKCSYCMGYLDENSQCEFQFCESHIPEQYR